MALQPVRVRVHHEGWFDRLNWRLHRLGCNLAPNDCEYVALEQILSGPRAPESCRRCYPDTTLLLGGAP